MSLSVAVLFGLLWFLQRVEFDFGRLFNPCGFKQRTGWPCPACGMTRSVLAFARAEFVTSFYLQPASALLCWTLVVVAFFAFLTGVLGVYSTALDRFLHEVKIRHVVVGLIVILAAGWAVTLAQALAAQ